MFGSLDFWKLDLLALSFAFFNGLRIVSYAPQIVVLARDTSGARSISVASYAIWTGANATTALYVWSRLGDVPVAALNAVNTLCCIVIIGLTLYKRAAPNLPPRVSTFRRWANWVKGHGLPLGAAPPALDSPR